MTDLAPACVLTSRENRIPNAPIPHEAKPGKKSEPSGYTIEQNIRRRNFSASSESEEMVAPSSILTRAFLAIGIVGSLSFLPALCAQTLPDDVHVTPQTGRQ